MHKSVRPENFCDFVLEEQELDSILLIGFNQARIAERETALAGDRDWEEGFYKDPDRQWLKSKEVYIM